MATSSTPGESRASEGGAPPQGGAPLRAGVVGSRWRAVALVGLGFVGGFLGAALVGAWLLFDSMCGTIVIGQATSPDGKWTAIAYFYGCGVTTRDSVNVSLSRKRNPEPRGRGSIFAAVPTYERPGQLWANVVWESPGRLRIEYDGNIHVMEERSSYRGVEVVYKRSLY